ncbi:MAG: alpha/beta fold hydrolase [Gemmataceae bacterium]|nr:alpha/beta fold hydrolase [Gemmataceae bacterium]
MRPVAIALLAPFALLAALTLLPARLAAGDDKKPAPKSLEGLWSGTLKTGLVDLRLVVRITTKDGAYAGTMDSVDQGVKAIPIESIELKDETVTLQLKTLAAVFEGKLKEDASEMAGRWKQAGGNLALTFKRTDKAPELVRPQLPKKPYPYAEHAVTYENKKAGIKLAGTLTAPRGDGPFPAAIMLTGSGPQDRDETIFGHKPFLVIADHLTRRGVAVLRVDDRGIGGSTGNVMNATVDDNVQDVLAGLAFLKGRPDINQAKMGLIGHSEGGLLAPLVATRSKDVAFLVLLAGTALPGEEILYLQGQAIVKSMGLKGDALKRQRAIQELFFTAIKQEPDNDKAIKLIKERLEELKKTLSPLELLQFAVQQKALDAQLKTITTPWFRSFLSYDPRTALREVEVPVLALFGEKDVQVPPKENLEAMAKALAEGGHKDHTLKELPGLNHLFQSAKTGAISEYVQIEETFAPAALTIISEWILKRTK